MLASSPSLTYDEVQARLHEAWHSLTYEEKNVILDIYICHNLIYIYTFITVSS